MKKKYFMPEAEVIGLDSYSPLCESIEVPISEDPATGPAC